MLSRCASSSLPIAFAAAAIARNSSKTIEPSLSWSISAIIRATLYRSDRGLLASATSTCSIASSSSFSEIEPEPSRSSSSKTSRICCFDASEILPMTRCDVSGLLCERIHCAIDQSMVGVLPPRYSCCRGVVMASTACCFSCPGMWIVIGSNAKLYRV